MELDRLEIWGYDILMKFNKVKCKVWHLGWDSHKNRYGLGREYLRSTLRRRVWACWLIKDST